MGFQQKLDSILYKLAVFWENKRLSKKKTGILIIGIVFFSMVLFQGGENNLFEIFQVKAAIVREDNSVDADSDIDSVANIGQALGGTSYLQAQSLDGTDQRIRETTLGGGGSSILAKIQQQELVDNRNYNPDYHESWYQNGHQTTVGFPNFENPAGLVQPLPMDTTIENITTEDGIVKDWGRNVTGDRDYNVSYTGQQYYANGGRFNVLFRKNYVKIETRWFSILQQPDRVGVVHNTTNDYTNWQSASSPDNITVAPDNRSLVYYNVFGDSDYNISYQGDTLKELIHVRRDTFPGTPYPLAESYIVWWTQLNFTTEIDLYDKFGAITADKIVRGLIYFKDQLGDIKAFLPLGNATSIGMPDEDILWRLRKVTAKSWYLLAGIRYGWATHTNRVNDIFIDPSWTVGQDGESWGNAVTFYQTMENKQLIMLNYIQVIRQEILQVM